MRRQVTLPIEEIVRALEGSDGNTDTDPRWLAAAASRQLKDWDQRSLVIFLAEIAKEIEQ